MKKEKNTLATIFSIAVFAIQMLLHCPQAQAQLTLVSNAKSDYHIVLVPNATAVDEEAAKVLQTYLHKISGAALPIATESINTKAKQLVIGNTGLLPATDTAGLGKDGVLIKETGNAVVFAGGYRKGVLYSVYTFLDSVMNCKMYTKEVVDIPKQKTISLPAGLYIKQTPAFDYRMSAFINLSKEYCDFNRQNYFLEDWGLWVHSFGVLLPGKKYFHTHPEYYSLVNGKRTPGQLCLSNPDVLKVLVDNLADLVKKKPEARFWSISQNDNELYCQCEGCTKLDASQGSHMASILSFVNKAANYFPDKTIVTLAYQYSQKPPKSIVPNSNVLVMLCSLNEERGTPIATNKTSQFNTDFNNWLKLTDQIFIWDYLVQFSNSMGPFPNLYTLQPNIHYYYSKGVDYIFEEGFPNQASEFSELRTYLISQLMWNEHADIKLAMDNFINAYYGPRAAPFIKQYIQQLHSDAATSKAKLFIFGAPADQRNTFLTLQHLEHYKNIFEKALAVLDKKDVYYQRVQKEYVPVLFAEADVTQALMTVNNLTSASDKQKFKNMLTNFYTIAKEAGIRYLNEGRKSIDDYYKQQIVKTL